MYVSPQVADLLGYSANEWLSDPGLVPRIIHPDDWDRVRRAGEHVRRTGEPSHIEYRYLTADGRIVWVLDETYVVRDERGEPDSVQGYIVDITERKRAEEERDRLRDELNHAQKLEALGRLAGGVAHDFNNMLTAIKGYSELLLEALEPGGPGRDEAEQIRRAAEHAAALPRQLLAFGRKQVLDPRRVDLDEVVSSTSNLLKRLVDESIDIVTVPGSQSARVVVDPNQIEQALLNLTVNARDAMPAGGRISISTSRAQVDDHLAAEHEVAAGHYALLAVSDTGQGMDADTKARLFEPFFTTKPPGQGSGLGLSTVYGFVRQSGGFISVSSELGAGTSFEIYLPCLDAEIELELELEPSADDSRGAPAAAARASIVLVEDEEFVRELAKTTLERAGYRVVAASSAAQALVTLGRSEFALDVLVTDMVMPGMGGRELAERVLSSRPEIGVVLMSGYTDEAPVLLGTDETRQTFLEKPFSPRDLAEAVGAVLGQSNGRQTDDRRAIATAPLAAGDVPAEATCLIADDHPAVLDSVSRYLRNHGVDVVSRVARGDEALAEIERLKPTIALLDVGMMPLGGIEVAERAAEVSPETRIVLYTGSRDREILVRALAAGARGFVLKESALKELLRALSVVARGGTYVDAELAASLATAHSPEVPSPLTPREREILGLLAEGMTNEKVGSALGIAAETVQSHVRNSMTKLDADTRTAAVAVAIRQSLIG